MSQADGKNRDLEVTATTTPSSGATDPDATFDTAAAAAFSSAERASEVRTIGPYQLIRKLGEGGMGQVWLAEQTAPIHRQVALKLIRVGRYDDSVLQRFYAERQSLALMDHPAIAKVFDAGATPDGQPYFVMEYVPGQPITDYCDRKRLKIPERLELFIKVCEGVQHAHQKAVMHRDLKPANILVVEVDGKPVPRIIDFGLAKAASAQLNGTLVTQAGGWVGTPGYMSPEQADPTVMDVDTRTDVYSLGAVLYVLLTGFLPAETRDWRNQRFDEFLRRLREEDPPRPSTKVSSGKGSSQAMAEARRADPNQLVSLLKGDLDWITMKALEKDRARRYGTPMELAADIERYLKNEPIVARPATTTYRLRKYVRRHRLSVAVAAGLVLLLAGFAVMQAVQIRRVTRERDRANRVTAFMQQIFKVSNPSEARGNTITARELLDKASKDIDTGLAKDPELQSQMMQTMGTVYDSLGLYSKAEPLLRHAVEIRKAMFGSSNRDTLESSHSLAFVLQEESQYPEADKLMRETMELQRRAFGPKDRDTLESAAGLAVIWIREGQYLEAEKMCRETMDIAARTFGPQDEVTLLAEKYLATDLGFEGKYPEAEKSLRDIYDQRRRRVGDDDPSTLDAQHNVGNILFREQRAAEAESIYRDCLARRTRVLGPEHQDTIRSKAMVGMSLQKEKRFPEAEIQVRDAHAAMLKTLGPDHHDTLQIQSVLAQILGAEGKSAEAEQLLRQTYESERRTLGPDHQDTLISLAALGDMQRAEKHFAEAEKSHQETLDAWRHKFGDDHPQTASLAFMVGEDEALQGKRDQAFHNLDFAFAHQLDPDSVQMTDSDPALKSLHGDPRFAALVAKAHQLLAAIQK